MLLPPSLLSIPHLLFGHTKKKKQQVIVLDYQHLSLVEQWHLEKQSDVVLGVHGAGLTASYWMRPGTLFIEVEMMYLIAGLSTVLETFFPPLLLLLLLLLFSSVYLLIRSSACLRACLPASSLH